MSTTTQLMTADEFLRQYGDESGVELVDGQVVRLPMPGAEHGKVCFKVTMIFGTHVLANHAGWVLTHDTFVRTRTNPEGCRGPDLLFMSYDTFPADKPIPKGALTPPLDLVVEVRSPSNTIREMTDKANEYLDAGVKVVLILDPDSESVGVFRLQELPQRFHNGDVMTLPDVLPGFAVPVKQFFE